MRGSASPCATPWRSTAHDPYALADDVLLPLETVPSLGGGTRPASGSELAVHGAEVSALHRVAGVLEVTGLQPDGADHGGLVPGRSGWLVDLRGYPLDAVRGLVRATALGIATARLRDG